MKMTRTPSFLLVVAVALLALTVTPAAAADKLVLHALGAETGASTGAALDTGNSRNISVYARVTAGSGTVNPFDVWIECSIDGSNWTECALDDRTKATTTGGATFTDNTVKLVAETAVTTSAVYSGRLTSLATVIRARWNISGSTPSETFEVIAVLK